MNIEPASRPGWLKYTLLAVLASVGLYAGYYLSGGMSAPGSSPLANGPTGPRLSAFAAADLTRFPMSSFDVKDQVEAPDLASDAFGRVYLVWASQTSESLKSLNLSRSEDGGRTFPAPREVTRSGIFRVTAQMRGKTMERALRMLPHAVARDSALHLAWTEALPNDAGVRMVVASSTDAGATFGSPLQVHRGDGARATFTSFAAGADNTLVCSWLDKRNGPQQAYAAVRRTLPMPFEEEMVVHEGDDDGGVCPCCPTASLVAPDGTVYVAFRNVADGFRDIAIGVLRPGQNKFEGPYLVVPPTWKFDGCPHDGASMALLGNRLHIVWMDARTGSQRCYHARANRNDMKFISEELHPIPVGTQGNAKLHADSSGRLHAVWEESTTAPAVGTAGKHQHEPPAPVLGTGGRAIQYAILGADERFGPARAVAARTGAFQGRPALTVTAAGRIVIAWNELDESGKAIVVRSLADGDIVSQGGRP